MILCDYDHFILRSLPPLNTAGDYAWRLNKYCQLTCWENGFGYAGDDCSVAGAAAATGRQRRLLGSAANEDQDDDEKVAMSADLTYIGCYKDMRNYRDLTDRPQGGYHVTMADCADACSGVLAQQQANISQASPIGWHPAASLGALSLKRGFR